MVMASSASKSNWNKKQLLFVQALPGWTGLIRYGRMFWDDYIMKHEHHTFTLYTVRYTIGTNRTGDDYMATASLNIRTDAEIKSQAEELLAEFGLNMTTAVNMFLRQIVRTKEIPLELSLKPRAVGTDEGLYIYKGIGDKNILDLVGKIKLADGYDYKSMREGN